MEVFVSYRYDPTDAAVSQVLNWVDTILRSFQVGLIDGRSLGGAVLNQAIMDRIEASDGLIAIFTGATPAPAVGVPVPTSEYVRTEYTFAVAKKRPAIAIVLTGVTPPGGVLSDRERIDLDPAHAAPGLLKLVQTIGLWRQSMGRTVTVRLEPEKVGRNLARSGVTECCFVRLTSLDDDDPGAWRSVRVKHMPGGAFVRVAGVRDDSLIQIRAELNEKRWRSPECEQWVAIPLDNQV